MQPEPISIADEDAEIVETISNIKWPTLTKQEQAKYNNLADELNLTDGHTAYLYTLLKEAAEAESFQSWLDASDVAPFPKQEGMTTQEVDAALAENIKRGYIEDNGDGNFSLTDAGIAHAKSMVGKLDS